MGSLLRFQSTFTDGYVNGARNRQELEIPGLAEDLPDLFDDYVRPVPMEGVPGIRHYDVARAG
jgi:hypothetical protein